MAALKVPFRRVHTGTFAGDQMQRVAQQAAQSASQVATDLTTAKATYGSGFVRIVLADADYRLSDAEASAAFILFEGALTASRTVTIPRAASDEAAYARWFNNSTTGGTGFAITFRNDDGSVSIPAGVADLVVVSKTYGPRLWV